MNQMIIQKMKQKNKYIKFFEDYRKFSGKTLINIDIQPSYMNDYKFLEDWVKMINQCDSSERIIFMYNGDEYGYSENDYRYWLWEIGVDEDTLESAMFYSKYYGFFRNPMDFGIEDYEIINLVKYMIEKGANDSRNLGKDFWDGFIEKYGNKDIREHLEIAEDCVYIPEVMDFLKNYNNIVICGGGKFQCLKEIEIVLEILGKTYETYDEFIYENKSYNYKYILDTLCSQYKWGNVISSKTKEFEEEETPIDSDDYITKFNTWLFKKFNNPDKFYTNGIKIKTPTDWYGKST